MRIAILCYGPSGKGGMETVISHIIGELNELGHDAELFLLGGSHDQSWLGGCTQPNCWEGSRQQTNRIFKVRVQSARHPLAVSPRSDCRSRRQSGMDSNYGENHALAKSACGLLDAFTITDISYGLLKKPIFTWLSIQKTFNN